MTERDLIGTWQKITYGDVAVEGRHILHLRSDGTAVAEGEYRGKPYHYDYDWRLIVPDRWELRRIIPLGEIPELEEETIEVEEHTVIQLNEHSMSFRKPDYEEVFEYQRLS
jgi:hypothetical protein